jgi:hypothetical protein
MKEPVMSRLIFVSIAVAATLSACVTFDNTAEPKEEKQFVTGSNIGRKDRADSGVTVLSREALEQVQRSGGAAKPPSN